jgi:hypothetical protein
VNDELRDIEVASDGDGCNALYIILHFMHLTLTDTEVEMRIPCKGISDTFDQHVNNIGSTFENEAIHGHVYTRYEGLELVIGTLHPKYESAIRHKTEIALENKNEQAKRNEKP